MWIEALKPLTVRLSEGDLHLQPGKPVDLPEYQARRLLKKASGKVRIVAFLAGDWGRLQDEVKTVERIVYRYI